MSGSKSSDAAKRSIIIAPLSKRSASLTLHPPVYSPRPTSDARGSDITDAGLDLHTSMAEIAKSSSHSLLSRAVEHRRLQRATPSSSVCAEPKNPSDSPWRLGGSGSPHAKKSASPSRSIRSASAASAAVDDDLEGYLQQLVHDAWSRPSPTAARAARSSSLYFGGAPTGGASDGGNAETARSAVDDGDSGGGGQIPTSSTLLRIVEEDEDAAEQQAKLSQSRQSCVGDPTDENTDTCSKRDNNHDDQRQTRFRIGSFPASVHEDDSENNTGKKPSIDTLNSDGLGPPDSSRNVGQNQHRLLRNQDSDSNRSRTSRFAASLRKKSSWLLSAASSSSSSLRSPYLFRRNTRRSESRKANDQQRFDRQNHPCRKQGLQQSDSFQMESEEEPRVKKEHHLFVQLDELYLPCSDDGQMEFRETGRWIKYEECLEAGAEKWGKPQLSSLSFHSLLELRQCIENGTIMLDLNEDNVPAALEQIVGTMCHHEQILPTDQLPLLDVLLLRHKHVHERGHSLAGRHRSYNSLYHYFYRQQSLMSPLPQLSPVTRHASHANLALAARQRQASHGKLSVFNAIANGASKSRANSRATSLMHTPQMARSVAASRDRIPDSVLSSESRNLLCPPTSGGADGHFPAHRTESAQAPAPKSGNLLDRRPSLDPSHRLYTNAVMSSTALKTPTFHIAPASVVTSHEKLNVADKLLEDDEGEKRAQDAEGNNGRVHGLPPRPPTANDSRNHLLTQQASLKLDQYKEAGHLPAEDSMASLPISQGMSGVFSVPPSPSPHPSRATSSQQNRHFDSDIYKRLQKDSESASIMCGAVNFLQKPTVAFVRFDEPVEIPEIMEVPNPVRFLFLLFGPLNTGIDFHDVGRSIGTLLSNKQFREHAYNAQHRDDLIEAINEFLDSSIVLPPGDWDEKSLLDYDQMKTRNNAIQQRRAAMARRPSDMDKLLEEEKEKWKGDPLRRTGKWFGGLRREAKKRYAQYYSDVMDAFTWWTVTCVVFTFLTCFIPALTFGAILSVATDGWLGVTETLVATSIGGMLFALFSAQPLLLVGVCGPMLIFEEGLYNFCQYYGLSESVLLIRFWSAVWALVFAVLTVAWEGPFVIKYVTPFSDDIVTALVSVIFFADCFAFINRMFKDHPIEPLSEYCEPLINESSWNIPTTVDLHHPNATNYLRLEAANDNYGVISGVQPNVALLACILVGTTFLVAFTFRKVENSKYFGRQVRKTLGDVGLSMAVILMVVFDWIYLNDNNLSTKLKMDKGLVPTLDEKRGWLIRPWPVVPWVPGAAILPGFVLFLIIFVETEACQLLLAKRSRCVRKGTGYHVDLLLSGVLLVLCALFGLPWLTADSVRSMAHVNSLTKYKLRAPGQKPKVDSVVDQRVTSFMLHASIGLTLLLLATNILTKVPLAILFGVFLYLGVMNLTGVEMLHRSILFFVPSKYHPDNIYTKRVKPLRMHLYTLLQLTCFVLVCTIKSIKKTAWTFPFAILMAVAIRHLVVPKFFTDYELHALDAHDAPDVDAENDDLYERGLIASALYHSPRGSSATSGSN